MRQSPDQVELHRKQVSEEQVQGAARGAVGEKITLTMAWGHRGAGRGPVLPVWAESPRS